MMDKMRSIVPTVMWVVIVAFIGLMFFGWGMDFAGGGSTRQSVGKIDGQEISLQTFERLVAQERERLRQSASPEEAENKERQVPQRLWDEQISNLLLNKTFKQMRLEGNADETFDYLKTNPPPGIDTASYFRTNGVFDTAKYIAFLNNPKSYDNPSMRELEQYLYRFVIPGRKLEILLGAGAIASRSVVAREYQEQKERAVLEYAAVSNSRFVVDSSEYSNAKIASYYQAHPDSFKTKEPQMELSFVTARKEATAADEALLETEIKELKQKIDAKETTFDEVAKAESDDLSSAVKGGDFGWVGKGAMVPEMEAVAFASMPGVVSEPVKSRFGFHLIVIDSLKKGPNGVDSVRARHILKRIVPSLETLEGTKDLLDSLRLTAEVEGLAKAVAQWPALRVDSTGLFKRGEYVPRMGYVPGLLRFVIDNKEGSIGEMVLENKEAFFVVQVKRKLGKGILPLADVRERIVQMIKKDVQKQMALKRFEPIVKGLSASSPLGTLSAQDSLISSGVTDTITRGSYVPALGFGGKAFSIATALKNGAHSGIVELPDGYCVVRKIWHQPVDSVLAVNPEVASIEQRLVGMQRQQMYSTWLAAMKRSTPITSNLDKYYTE